MNSKEPILKCKNIQCALSHVNFLYVTLCRCMADAQGISRQAAPTDLPTMVYYT